VKAPGSAKECGNTILQAAQTFLCLLTLDVTTEFESNRRPAGPWADGDAASTVLQPETSCACGTAALEISC